VSAPVALAVVGAGLIGRKHAALIAADPGAHLTAIVDPAPAGRSLAANLGARWFPSITDMIAQAKPEGVIVATPNQLHVAHGLESLAAGLPVLVEKPLADSVAEGLKLVEAAEAAGLPLLTGHHRRYNPMIAKAMEIIASGRLGKILALQGSFWLMKPDSYYEPAWRRAKGAGPILLNLIHDVDLFRALCGEITAVQALSSNALREHEVEETAAILLRFANGALGTVTVSDAVTAPWSWEMTTGENPAYPRQEQACYQIGGTHGALSLPQLEVWWNPGARGWWEPLARERVPYVPEDPLVLQIRHFCDVIRSGAAPIMSGREGLATLRVIEAIQRATTTGELTAV
jgi:predicted dehydrogenase